MLKRYMGMLLVCCAVFIGGLAVNQTTASAEDVWADTGARGNQLYVMTDTIEDRGQKGISVVCKEVWPTGDQHSFEARFRAHDGVMYFSACPKLEEYGTPLDESAYGQAIFHIVEQYM